MGDSISSPTARRAIRAGLVGVGKMGLSHLAILGANPRVEIKAVCDSAVFVTSALHRNIDVATYKDHRQMMDEAGVDCVVVSTPTATHFNVASDALERGLHVFVEKPLSLDSSQSKTLAALAKAKACINQVGYHNRFIGTFREAQRLVRAGALGEIYHVSGSAFGQVVIRPKSGVTWRSKKSEGGGCLHDYASHVVDLMNFVVGPPLRVLGAHMRSIYSRDVEDAVYATLLYPNGASGQLETNWSDETHRKMSTTIIVYGTNGKVIADRQECRVFLKAGTAFERYCPGWTVRYITDLQPPVAFYLRGEEYTSQLDRFIDAIDGRSLAAENSFASAYETDRVIELIMRASRQAS